MQIAICLVGCNYAISLITAMDEHEVDEPVMNTSSLDEPVMNTSSLVSKLLITSALQQLFEFL